MVNNIVIKSLISLLLLAFCSYTESHSTLKVLQNKSKSENVILIKDLNNGVKFDSVYFISGPRFEGEVKNIIGSTKDFFIHDNRLGIFYVKNNVVISNEEEYVQNLNKDDESGLGYISFGYNDKLFLKKVGKTIVISVTPFTGSSPN